MSTQQTWLTFRLARQTRRRLPMPTHRWRGGIRWAVPSESTNGSSWIHRCDLDADRAPEIREDLLASTSSRISRWARQVRKKPFEAGSLRSRRILEQYFAEFDLVPPRFAAYRLGMTQESMTRAIDHLTERLGVGDEAIGNAEFAIRRDFIDGIKRFFPALRGKAFSSISSSAKAVQAALQSAGVDLEPVRDQMATEQGDSNAIATLVDIVSLRGTTSRHSVWLDFRKPAALDPDRTSLLTLAAHEAELTLESPRFGGRLLATDLVTYRINKRCSSGGPASGEPVDSTARLLTFQLSRSGLIARSLTTSSRNGPLCQRA